MVFCCGLGVLKFGLLVVSLGLGVVGAGLLTDWHLSAIPGSQLHLHLPDMGSKTKFAGWHVCSSAVESQQFTNLWQSKSYGLFPLRFIQ